VWTGHNISL
jgi:hypothetical protein